MENQEAEESENNFILENYKALRQEIVAFQERAYRIQLTGFSGIPVLIGGSLELRFMFLVALGPLIVFIFFMLLMYQQDSILRVGRYLKDYVEPHFLSRPNSIIGWEAFIETKRTSRKIEKLTKYTSMLAFVFYYIGATCIVFKEVSALLAFIYAIGSFFMVYIIFALFKTSTKD